MLGVGQRGAFGPRDLIIAVFDAQQRRAENTYPGFALVGFRQPDVAYFLKAAFEISLLSPPGRVYSRLAVHSRYRKVLGIDPNSATKQELVSISRLRINHVYLITLACHIVGYVKYIVLVRDRRMLLVRKLQ